MRVFSWMLSCRWRPYRVECTGSLLTSEVKRRRARLVLGWGTAWEDLRVLSAFVCCVVRGHDAPQVRQQLFRVWFQLQPVMTVIHVIMTANVSRVNGARIPGPRKPCPRHTAKTSHFIPSVLLAARSTNRGPTVAPRIAGCPHTARHAGDLVRGYRP